MAKQITKGNLAFFEYPAGAANPEFNFDDKAVLFIFGYHIYLAGLRCRVAKSFATTLQGYKMLGPFNSAIKQVKNIDASVADGLGLNLNNTLLFIKDGN